MALKLLIWDCFDYFRVRAFLVLWISLVIYLFYDTFIYYKNGKQFFYIRRILGFGLYVSRGTATVLNLCGALILLPQCKKLNQILYKILSNLWPGLFFFWLEKAKSFHMTVATTLVIFGVLHSVSHFVNLWNFSRGFDEECLEINFANYRNENPFYLLLSVTCITGLLMLLSTLLMGVTSLRVIRRRVYNAFWYAHQLYLPFMVLFVIHPLSGVLKKETTDSTTSLKPSHIDSWISGNATVNTPRFTAIESQTWLWMSIPLTCFFIDLLWRIFSRNRAIVDILEARHMAGRTISLKLSWPHEKAMCRAGQYVVLQCPHVSLLEWHPFTVVKAYDFINKLFNFMLISFGANGKVGYQCHGYGHQNTFGAPWDTSALPGWPNVTKVPTLNQRNFVVWIRVKGDWTEALEKLLKERGPRGIIILVDGPFSSPMEGVSRNEVSICVAAGVGLTPFVAVLHQMLQHPRSRLPGRIHLLWIVRHDQELTWIAELADKTIRQLRDANRPDRLHLLLHVTKPEKAHVIEINEKGRLTHVLNRDDEKATFLTPNLNTNECANECYDIAKDYPLLGCRVRRGRPHWDQVFGYWVHLYPKSHLNLYCCGPKKLVRILRNKCKETSRNTKTKITFIHEGFS